MAYDRINLGVQFTLFIFISKTPLYSHNHSCSFRPDRLLLRYSSWSPAASADVVLLVKGTTHEVVVREVDGPRTVCSSLPGADVRFRKFQFNSIPSITIKILQWWLKPGLCVSWWDYEPKCCCSMRIRWWAHGLGRNEKIRLIINYIDNRERGMFMIFWEKHFWEWCSSLYKISMLITAPLSRIIPIVTTPRR